MKVKIVYASMTGNDEDIAEILQEDLQDYGLTVDCSDVSFTDASDYLHNDLCILVTYTYGEGKMTDETADFYDQMRTLNLKGKYFAVLGSGDKTYGRHFCENVFDFEKLFQKCGAQEIVKPITIENAPNDDDVALIDQAAQKINEQINAK